MSGGAGVPFTFQLQGSEEFMDNCVCFVWDLMGDAGFNSRDLQV